MKAGILLFLGLVFTTQSPAFTNCIPAMGSFDDTQSHFYLFSTSARYRKLTAVLKRSPTPFEWVTVERAHQVGHSPYSAKDIYEKTRILSQAFPDREIRRQILEKRIAGEEEGKDDVDDAFAELERAFAPLTKKKQAEYEDLLRGAGVHSGPGPRRPSALSVLEDRLRRKTQKETWSEDDVQALIAHCIRAGESDLPDSTLISLYKQHLKRDLEFKPDQSLEDYLDKKGLDSKKLIKVEEGQQGAIYRHPDLPGKAFKVMHLNAFSADPVRAERMAARFAARQAYELMALGLVAENAGLKYVDFVRPSFVGKNFIERDFDDDSKVSGAFNLANQLCGQNGLNYETVVGEINATLERNPGLRTIVGANLSWGTQKAVSPRRFRATLGGPRPILFNIFDIE